MNDYIIVDTDNYLEHHGILGQKWGVRRYQNADGSLTEAGKKRQRYKEQDSYDAKQLAKNTVKTAIGTTAAAGGLSAINKMGQTFGWQVLSDMIFRGKIGTPLTNNKDYYWFDIVEDAKEYVPTALSIVGGVPLAIAGTLGVVGTGAAIVKKYFDRSKDTDRGSKK